MNNEMTVPVLISLLCIALVTFMVSWFVRSNVTIVASVALGTGFTMEAYSDWQLGYVDPLMAVTFFPSPSLPSPWGVWFLRASFTRA